MKLYILPYVFNNNYVTFLIRYMYKCYFYILRQGVKIGTNSIFCHNDLKIKNIVQQVLKYSQSFVFLKSMRSYIHVYVPS